jgi:dextranase
VIKWAQQLSESKPVILAAYLKPFREEPLETMDRAHNAALILTAVIISNGGYHLLLGEENGVLTQGYYVDYTKANESFMRAIRTYYDFFIRYANVFFDKDLRDVSMTHLQGDNLEYQLENVDCSTYGKTDKVWAIVREKPGLKVISLINLKGNSDDRWNEGKEAPTLTTNIQVKIQLEQKVKHVFIASPDRNMGRAERLDYELVSEEKGQFAAVTIPELLYWDVLVIELE